MVQKYIKCTVIAYTYFCGVFADDIERASSKT